MSQNKLMNPAAIDKLLKAEFDKIMKHPDHGLPQQISAAEQSYPTIRKTPMFDVNNPLDMIFMRMRMGKYDPAATLQMNVIIPFNFIEAYCKDGKAFVFVVTKQNRAVTLEDGDLFPSDSLITQLRLLAE